MGRRGGMPRVCSRMVARQIMWPLEKELKDRKKKRNQSTATLADVSPRFLFWAIFIVLILGVLGMTVNPGFIIIPLIFLLFI